jgi:tetratricopeptide (TPR) repeat protein
MLKLQRVRVVLLFLFVLTCMASKKPEPLNHKIMTWWPDPSTGLMWTGTDVDGLRAWRNFPQANAACNELQVDGRSGWRLPTIDEIDAVRGTTRLTRSNGTPWDVVSLKWTYVVAVWIWSDSPADKPGEYYTQRVNGLWGHATSKPSDHFGHVAFCVRAMEPDVFQAAKEAPVKGAVTDLTMLRAMAPLLKAQAAYNADQFQTSIDQARQVLTIKPDFGVAYYGLGLAEGMLGQWDQAVADLQQAKKLGFDSDGLGWAMNHQKVAAKGETLNPKKDFRPAFDGSE